MGNWRLLGGRVIPLGLSFLPQDTRRLGAEENADPRFGSRNSPWYRLDYCQHRSRGPGPHGELSPGPGSLHPRPNHPLQLAFLDRVLPPTPAPPPPPPWPSCTRAPAHPQLTPPPNQPGNGDSPWGDKEIFFFLSSQDRFHPASPISHGGQGETQRNPSTPPQKREKP